MTAKKKEEVISSFSNKKEPAAAGHSKNHFKFKINDLCEEIDRLSTINDKQINPWAFVQQKTYQRGHPEGIVDALTSVIKAWSIIDEPWAYAEKIFQV